MIFDDNILYKFNIDSKNEELKVLTHKILKQYGGETSYKCKKIFIGKSVEEIDKGFFTYFNSVQTIEVDPENENFFATDNCLICKKTSSLIKAGSECKGIPENVTTICDHAFEGYNNKNNRDLFIPETVKSIEADAFKNACFEKITIKHEIDKISNFAMRGFDGICDFPDCFFNTIKSKNFRIKFCADKVSNYRCQPLLDESKDVFDKFISEFLVDFLAKYSKSSNFINYLSNDWVMDPKYNNQCFEVAKNYKEICPIIMSKISNINVLPTFDSLSTEEHNLNNYEEDNAYIDKNFIFENKKNKIVVKQIKNNAAAIFPIKYFGKDVEYKDCFNLNQKMILRDNYDENVLKTALKVCDILEIDCESVPIYFVTKYWISRIIIGAEFRHFTSDKMVKYDYPKGTIEVNPNNPFYVTNKTGTYLYNKIKKEIVLCALSKDKLPLDMEYIGEFVQSVRDRTKYKHLKILNEKCLAYMGNNKEDVKFSKNAVEIDLKCIYGLRFDYPITNGYSSGVRHIIHFSENVNKIIPNYDSPFNIKEIKLDPHNRFYKTINNTCLIDTNTDCLIMSSSSLMELPNVKELNIDAFLYGMNSFYTYVVPNTVKKINFIRTNYRDINGHRVFPSLAFNVSDKKFNKILKDVKNKNIPCYNDCKSVANHYISNSCDKVSYVLFSNNKIIIKNTWLNGSSLDCIVEELESHNIELIGLEDIDLRRSYGYILIPKSVQYFSIKEDVFYSYHDDISFCIPYRKDEVPAQLADCISKIENKSLNRKRYNFIYL